MTSLSRLGMQGASQTCLFHLHLAAFLAERVSHVCDIKRTYVDAIVTPFGINVQQSQSFIQRVLKD